jgi:membrane-bound lytic murein transglycosylase A
MPRIFFLLSLSLLAACATSDPTVLLPANYGEMPGWQRDHHAEAYTLFTDSCAANARRSKAYVTKTGEAVGERANWQAACDAAFRFPNPTDEEARAFFEANFTPVRVTTGNYPYGQLTGYYEPLLHGALARHPPYTVPVYGVPDDLVPGEPYLTRAEIAAGAIHGHAPVLLYVDDPVMLFFLHIQGSGKVRLEDGSLVGLQYAAQNGHEYVPIGKVLKDSGELEQASLQTIRDWLYAHPERAQEIMNENPSYIFFKIGPGDQMAKGALGLPLTGLRSAAIDDDRAAYGVPTYIATTHPDYDTGIAQPLERLLVSQDTGGALHGPHRIDIFFGRGNEAEWEAGHQNTRGLVYWLLPNGQGIIPRRPPVDEAPRAQ